MGLVNEEEIWGPVPRSNGKPLKMAGSESHGAFTEYNTPMAAMKRAREERVCGSTYCIAVLSPRRVSGHFAHMSSAKASQETSLSLTGGTALSLRERIIHTPAETETSWCRQERISDVQTVTVA